LSRMMVLYSPARWCRRVRGERRGPMLAEGRELRRSAHHGDFASYLHPALFSCRCICRRSGRSSTRRSRPKLGPVWRPPGSQVVAQGRRLRRSDRVARSGSESRGSPCSRSWSRFNVVCIWGRGRLRQRSPSSTTSRSSPSPPDAPPEAAVTDPQCRRRTRSLGLFFECSWGALPDGPSRSSSRSLRTSWAARLTSFSSVAVAHYRSGPQLSLSSRISGSRLGFCRSCCRRCSADLALEKLGPRPCTVAILPCHRRSRGGPSGWRCRASSASSSSRRRGDCSETRSSERRKRAPLHAASEQKPAGHETLIDLVAIARHVVVAEAWRSSSSRSAVLAKPGWSCA